MTTSQSGVQLPIQMPRDVDGQKVRELTKGWPVAHVEGFDWTRAVDIRLTEVAISPDWKVDNPQGTRYSRWLSYDSGLLVEEFQDVAELPDLSPAFNDNQYMKVGRNHYLLMTPIYKAAELMKDKRQPVLNIIRLATA